MLTNLILRVIFVLSVLKTEDIESTSDRSSCEPYRVLFFWHTSGGEDKSFIQQKRLITTVIRKVLNGTSIYVSNYDPSYNLTNFKKDRADTNKNIIGEVNKLKPVHSRNHAIPYIELRNAVHYFLTQRGDQRIAEQIVLVVNSKSGFHNEEMVKEELINRLTIITYTGMNTPTGIWTDLATDAEHLVILKDTLAGVDVTAAAEKILSLFCKDSRLRCDTDEYLHEGRCLRCSSICSFDSKDNCTRECPYHGVANAIDTLVSKVSDLKETVTRLDSNNSFYFITTTFCHSVVILLLTVILICMLTAKKRIEGMRHLPVTPKVTTKENSNMPIVIQETNQDPVRSAPTESDKLFPKSRVKKMQIVRNKKTLKTDKLYVSEDLTKLNHSVFTSVRVKQRDIVTSAWTREGKTFYRDVNGAVHEVTPKYYEYWLNLDWPNYRMHKTTDCYDRDANDPPVTTKSDIPEWAIALIVVGVLIFLLGICIKIFWNRIQSFIHILSTILRNRPKDKFIPDEQQGLNNRNNDLSSDNAKRQSSSTYSQNLGVIDRDAEDEVNIHRTE